MALNKHNLKYTDLKKDIFLTYKDKTLRLVLPENQVVTKRDVSEVIRNIFGFSSFKLLHVLTNKLVYVHNEDIFEQAVYVKNIRNFKVESDSENSETVNPCSYGEILIQENNCHSPCSVEMLEKSERKSKISTDMQVHSDSTSTESNSKALATEDLPNSHYLDLNYLQKDILNSSDLTFLNLNTSNESSLDKDMPQFVGTKPKNRIETDEKLMENAKKDLAEQVKKKSKRPKKEFVDVITLSSIDAKDSKLSVFVPTIENDNSKSVSKIDKNKKEKRDKKHKSCVIVKNHPILSSVKENCTTKYEEWKKVLQKCVNPESSDKPPKWFLDFMKQYKQDLIHDMVHKTTRKIFKATEGINSPLDCCRSQVCLKLKNVPDKECSNSVEKNKHLSEMTFIHEKVICDYCHNIIEGIWYRCCNCTDFDLCESCESRPDVHDINHVFLKIKRPVSTRGKQLLMHKSPILTFTLFDDIDLPSLNKDVESKLQLSFYDCKFIKDETIPDGAVMKPRTQFVKSWLVKNIGNVSWDSEVKLLFMWGTLPPRKCEIKVPSLEVGAEDLISIELRAPDKPGHYESHWQLQRCRQRFGPRIWCIIEVEDQKTTNNSSTLNPIKKTVKPSYEISEPLDKSAGKFISQTATPNNTPLEFSPPRTPDSNMDFLGIVKNIDTSARNEDKPEKRKTPMKLTVFDEFLSDQCPREFFVEASEYEDIACSIKSCHENAGTSTDSSMEVLSEDDNEGSEIREMASTLNTSVLSACSENDYVMVPWPECFVFESPSEGEKFKDDDVIVCQPSPSDDNEPETNDYVPCFLNHNKHSEKFSAIKNSETNNHVTSSLEKEFENNSCKIFDKEELSSVTLLNLKESDQKSQEIEASVKSEITSNKCELNKKHCIVDQQETDTTCLVQKLSAVSLNQKSVLRHNEMRNEAENTSSADPVNGLNNRFSEDALLLNLHEDTSPEISEAYVKVRYPNIPEEVTYFEPKISSENNFVSTHSKEIKEKFISYSSDGSAPSESVKVVPEMNPNDVEWSQILDDQIRPQSASKVATNIMNSALTAGAFAFNTAKAVFTTLQAKQPKFENDLSTYMDQLMEMGFCDRELNNHLLEEHHDLNIVVAKLIELNDNDWHQHH